MGGTLNQLGDDIAAVRQNLDTVKGQLGDSPGSLDQSLASAQYSARTMADKLDEQSQRFSDLEGELANAGKTGDFSRLAQITGADPEALASQLVSPVSVAREEVYPVVSFGAGMLPLYTALALWVGALLTAVFVRPAVTYTKRQIMGTDSESDAELADEDAEDEDEAEYNDENARAEDDLDEEAGKEESEDEASDADKPAFSPAQSYFGRYGIFALIGLVQATLAVAGLLVFTHAEPEHPFLLWLTCLVTALVFMLIVYTLVLSFGNAGKAIAVLILIIQVSGSGGAYPLPLLPDWFQHISGWLPATHAINAMRSAMAGIYQGDIWIQLGTLLLFVIPTLFLGLVLRRGLDGYNRRINDGIERTRIMA